MKILGVALLGLAFVVFASPSEDQVSLARSGQTGTPTPASQLVGTSTGLSPLSTLVGGDTCGSPTPISTLPFNDTGTTVGMANDSTNLLKFECFGAQGGGNDRPGPDVFYRFTIFGPGNSLTFSLTTTSNSYDPAIYVLSVCADLATCVNGADAGFGGDPETLTVSGLAAGTYIFGVDSSFSVGDPGNNEEGPYALTVTGNFGSTPTPTPTRTPTNTPTATPTKTPTNTPTATPTLTPTRAGPLPAPALGPPGSWSFAGLAAALLVLGLLLLSRVRVSTSSGSNRSRV